MKYYIILLFTFLLSFVSTAQEPITIGTSYTISSSVLKENRTIQIYLPKSYNDSTLTPQHYPVIYLLDSESNFNYLSAYVEKLSKYPYPSIPEMIIVGIVNTNRTRDLTPTAQNTAAMSQEQSSKIKGDSGGNSLFFDFIETELFPYINTNFRTVGYNILIGHSFGGITALNNLLTRTSMFNAYIVHDPSIWWDNKIILQNYHNAKDYDFQNRKLFLTQVDEKENTDHLAEHYNAIKEFDQFVTNNPPLNLQYEYIQYAGEDHGSIPMKGNLDGLRYIFDGYKINFKQLKTDHHLLENSFNTLSKNIHFILVPNEQYLTTIIKYFQQNNEIAVVDYLIQYKEKHYPKCMIINKKEK
ncbi:MULTISPECIES: alpha/beta hydrolase [unclassified Myroides]|uniref:alpha/beta hydrolase n=1 Tax=unclassified Myroides TaxID=2642485 RepID=UPI003100F475